MGLRVLMDKKIIGLFLIFLLILPILFSADVIIETNPNSSLTTLQQQIQQNQEFIKQFGDLRNQIDSLSIHVDERTNLLATWFDNKIDLSFSNFIVLIIIINICSMGLVLGIILFLKSKRIW